MDDIADLDVLGLRETMQCHFGCFGIKRLDFGQLIAKLAQQINGARFSKALLKCLLVVGQVFIAREKIHVVQNVAGHLSQAGSYEDMDEVHLADCVLCGCCSYVCPSNIPLSQMFALSKDGLRRHREHAA